MILDEAGFGGAVGVLPVGGLSHIRMGEAGAGLGGAGEAVGVDGTEAVRSFGFLTASPSPPMDPALARFFLFSTTGGDLILM